MAEAVCRVGDKSQQVNHTATTTGTSVDYTSTLKASRLTWISAQL
jgi:hypothetical protein